MPLLAEGVFPDGRNYTGENIPADEVVRMFGLSLPTQKNPRILYSDFKRPKKGSGEGVKPLMTVKNTLNGSFNGNAIRLTYWETRRKVSTGGRGVPPPEYILGGNASTTKIAIQHEMFVDPRNKEKMVFLMLHHENADSPLFHPCQKKFRFDNPGATAAKEWAQRESLSDVYQEIKTLPIDTLRTRAKGLGIYRIDEMDENGVRVAVSKAAEQNLLEFAQKWTNASTHLRGLCQEVLDLNFVVSIPIDGNGYKLVWSRVHGNTEITTAPNGRKAADVLLEHAVKDAKFIPLLQEALLGQHAEEVLARPQFSEHLNEIIRKGGGLSAHKAKLSGKSTELIDNMNSFDLVQYGFDNGYIWNDILGTKKVFLMDGDQVVEELCAVDKVQHARRIIDEIAEKDGDLRARLKQFYKSKIKKQ